MSLIDWFGIHTCLEMRVQLLKKFADRIDGIDLSGRTVGACFDLVEQDAQLLIAEGWAVQTITREEAPTKPAPAPRNDSSRRPAAVD